MQIRKNQPLCVVYLNSDRNRWHWFCLCFSHELMLKAAEEQHNKSSVLGLIWVGFSDWTNKRDKCFTERCVHVGSSKQNSIGRLPVSVIFRNNSCFESAAVILQDSLSGSWSHLNGAQIDLKISHLFTFTWDSRVCCQFRGLTTFFFLNQSDVTSRTLMAQNSIVAPAVQQGAPRLGYLGTTASSRAKLIHETPSSTQEEEKENLSSLDPQSPSPLLSADLDLHSNKYDAQDWTSRYCRVPGSHRWLFSLQLTVY